MSYGMTFVILLLAVWGTMSTAAWSEVYKCLDGKGGIVLKDEPCTITKDTPMPKAKPSSSLNDLLDMMKTLVDPSKRWEMEKHTDKLRETSACILHSPHVHIVGPRRDVRVWVNVMPDDIVLVTNGTFDSHVQVMGLKADDNPFVAAQQVKAIATALLTLNGA